MWDLFSLMGNPPIALISPTCKLLVCIPKPLVQYSASVYPIINYAIVVCLECMGHFQGLALTPPKAQKSK